MRQATIVGCLRTDETNERARRSCHSWGLRVRLFGPRPGACGSAVEIEWPSIDRRHRAVGSSNLAAQRPDRVAVAAGNLGTLGPLAVGAGLEPELRVTGLVITIE